MNQSLKENWRDTCTTLKVQNHERTLRKLLSQWTSWWRHYHSITHLQACLDELVQIDLNASERAKISMALWFHDAFYNTFRSDNEMRSARWAREFLMTHGADVAIAEEIHDLVMATRHKAKPATLNAALTVDIDLSILGQDMVQYDAFERNVRKEYWWVSKQRFAAARSSVLMSFLNADSIYHVQWFRDRYEQKARVNLARAISNLQADLPI